MSIFTLVKDNVTAADVADFYGITKSGRLYQCPFHNDKTPSMQVDERYYCHGCTATGDAIDLVAGIFNLKLIEAAEKIAADFNLVVTDNSITEKPVKKKSLRDEKNETIVKLIDYEKTLNQLLPIFAPKSDDTNVSQAFLFTQRKLDIIDDLIYHFYQNPTDEEIKFLMEKSNEITED